jgi:hypothetical protein
VASDDEDSCEVLVASIVAYVALMVVDFEFYDSVAAPTHSSVDAVETVTPIPFPAKRKLISTN